MLYLVTKLKKQHSHQKEPTDLDQSFEKVFYKCPSRTIDATMGQVHVM